MQVKLDLVGLNIYFHFRICENMDRDGESQMTQLTSKVKKLYNCNKSYIVPITQNLM